MKNTIIINGILQRSGTNLLNQLLLLHPDCRQPSTKIRENWFLHYSDDLWDYFDNLERTWANPQWQGGAYDLRELRKSIGDTLLTYLTFGVDLPENGRLLTKTPSVQRLERFPELFPESKLLLIVRDPRDVAASAYRSWAVPPLDTLAEWRQAAEAITAFEAKSPDFDYLLVRYEDLVNNMTEWVREFLGFLSLPSQSYGWNELASLPVFGSSESGVGRTMEVTESFQPVGRWQSLPEQLRQAVTAFELPQAAYFGYAQGDETQLSRLPDAADRIALAHQYLAESSVAPSAEPENYRSSKPKNALKSTLKAILGRRLVSRFARKHP